MFTTADTPVTVPGTVGRYIEPANLFTYYYYCPCLEVGSGLPRIALGAAIGAGSADPGPVSQQRAHLPCDT